MVPHCFFDIPRTYNKWAEEIEQDAEKIEKSLERRKHMGGILAGREIMPGLRLVTGFTNLRKDNGDYLSNLRLQKCSLSTLLVLCRKCKIEKHFRALSKTFWFLKTRRKQRHF